MISVKIIEWMLINNHKWSLIFKISHNISSYLNAKIVSWKQLTKKKIISKMKFKINQLFLTNNQSLSCNFEQ
jgi:hypothetical protein